MKFLDTQRREARNRSLWRLAYLGAIAATLLSIAALCTVLAHALGWTGPGPLRVFGAVLLLSIVIVVAGTLRAPLRGPNAALQAQRLGAVALSPQQDPAHRQLRNVAEEMAISAAIPPPHILLLPQSTSINAFPLGRSPEDAVVVVSAGSFVHLTRDELQALLAWCIGRIRDGDCALDTDLLGLHHGLLAPFRLFVGTFNAIVGAAARIPLGHTRSGAPADARHFAAFAALPLLLGAVISGLGYVLASLLQAAAVRRGMFKADAAVVELSRVREPLLGLLRKLGDDYGLARMNIRHADALSHFCFGPSGWMARLFIETHPSIERRLARHRGQADGAVVVGGSQLPRRPLPAGMDPAQAAQPAAARWVALAQAAPGASTAAMVALATSVAVLTESYAAASTREANSGSSPVDELAPIEWTSQGEAAPAVSAAGATKAASVAEPLRPGGRDEAIVAVLALFVQPLLPVRLGELLERERALFAGEPPSAETMVQRILALDARARVSLIEQAWPHLAGLPPPLASQLRLALQRQMLADGRVDLREWTEWAVLESLSRQLDQRRPTRRHSLGLRAVEVRQLLRWMVHRNTRSAAQALLALQTQERALGLAVSPKLPAEHPELFETCVDRLGQLQPQDQRLLLAALGEMARVDGQLCAQEWLLLRGLAALWDMAPTQLPEALGAGSGGGEPIEYVRYTVGDGQAVEEQPAGPVRDERGDEASA